MRLGVVDLGSNAVHLSIVDGRRGTPPLPTYSTKTRLQLAETASGEGALPAEAIQPLVDRSATRQ